MESLEMLEIFGQYFYDFATEAQIAEVQYYIKENEKYQLDQSL